MFASFLWNVLVERLGWVLVHSVWQFALIALAAVAVTALFPRRAASARYGVLLLALAAVMAAPVATSFCLTEPTAKAPVAEVTAEQAPGNRSNIESPGDAGRSAPASAPARTGDSVAQPPSPLKTQPTAMPSLDNPPQAWLASLDETFRPWLSVLVLLQCVGVIVFAHRPLLSWLTVRRLRADRVTPITRCLMMACRIAPPTSRR